MGRKAEQGGAAPPPQEEGGRAGAGSRVQSDATCPPVQRPERAQPGPQGTEEIQPKLENFV